MSNTSCLLDEEEKNNSTNTNTNLGESLDPKTSNETQIPTLDDIFVKIREFYPSITRAEVSNMFHKTMDSLISENFDTTKSMLNTLPSTSNKSSLSSTTTESECNNDAARSQNDNENLNDSSSYENFFVTYKDDLRNKYANKKSEDEDNDENKPDESNASMGSNTTEYKIDLILDDENDEDKNYQIVKVVEEETMYEENEEGAQENADNEGGEEEEEEDNDDDEDEEEDDDDDEEEENEVVYPQQAHGYVTISELNSDSSERPILAQRASQYRNFPNLFTNVSSQASRLDSAPNPQWSNGDTSASDTQTSSSLSSSSMGTTVSSSVLDISDANRNSLTSPDSTNPSDSKSDSKTKPDTKKFTLSRSSSNISPTSNEFVFKDSNNSNKILEGLNKLRLSKSLYDVVLKVDAEEFACHKCVLASLSKYFNAMFSSELAERKMTMITLNDLDPSTLKSIIDYAYTSYLTINDNNVQALLSASNLFDIKPIKDAW